MELYGMLSWDGQLSNTRRRHTGEAQENKACSSHSSKREGHCNATQGHTESAGFRSGGRRQEAGERIGSGTFGEFPQERKSKGEKAVQDWVIRITSLG